MPNGMGPTNNDDNRDESDVDMDHPFRSDDLGSRLLLVLEE
jgi:hypothetical protein